MKSAARVADLLREKDIPFFVVSGRDAETLKHLGFGDLHLRKPLDAVALKTAIDELDSTS